MFHNKPNKPKGTVAAGIAGAVIGAGVGVAATKVLSDKKTREKVKTVVSQVKKTVQGRLKDANRDVETGKREANKKLSD